MRKVRDIKQSENALSDSDDEDQNSNDPMFEKPALQLSLLGDLQLKELRKDNNVSRPPTNLEIVGSESSTLNK